MSTLNLGVGPVPVEISGEIQPHRFVGVNNAQAGAGMNTRGVSQTYAKDEAVAVDILGVVPVEAGAAVTEGALVETDAQGRAIDQSAGAVVARAVEGSTGAGQFVLCQLIPN